MDNAKLASSVPKLQGKGDELENNFPKWYRRFMAHAKAGGYYTALVGDPNLPAREDEDVSGSSAEAKRMKAALQANETAGLMLTLALDDDRLLAMLDKGITAEYPTGKSSIIWEAVLEKYRPKDGISQVALVLDLFSIRDDEKFKASDDPDAFFDRMTRLETQYNNGTTKMPEILKVAATIVQAPEEYHSVIADEQKDKGDTLTAEDLRVRMRNLWRIKRGVDKIKLDDDDDDDEMALSAITCFNCKEKGHIATKCPKKAAFKGRCLNCNQWGHRWRDCPSNYDEKKGETAAVSVEGETELLI